MKELAQEAGALFQEIREVKTVKTLLKKSFRVSAFSDDVDAVDPSTLRSIGILYLDFILDFTYDQNFLGARFESSAISLSKFSLNLLVSARKLFFAC